MDDVDELQAKAIQRQFGARMRALRHSRGLSQDRFAPVCGLHRTYVGAVERGECNISLVNICRIAQALGVPPATLLQGPDDEPPGED